MVMPTFWPRERAFWAYHLGAMAVIVLLSLFSIMLWRSLDAAYVLSSLLWMLPYTLATLLLRWLYHRYGAALGMARVVPWVLAYSTVAGMAVAASVSAMVLPLAGGELSWRSVLSGGLQGQLFICAWAFIYIAIQTQARQREAELRSLRLEMSLKDAQLHQLNEQLKPHFLFNALNNIRFLVQEDGARAEGMVVALSGMLRHSLQAGRQPRQTLQEELAVLQDYLTLVGGQLESRLQLEFSVAGGLSLCLVPTLLLQMLAENAIKHGLERLPKGGRLRVSLTGDAGRLDLRVGNDRPLVRGEGRPASGLGLGLMNIERRLRLLHGEQATLDVLPGESWFEVRVQLPLEYTS